MLNAGYPLSEVTAALVRALAARRHAAADDRRPGRDACRDRRRRRPRAAGGQCTSRSTGCGCTRPTAYDVDARSASTTRSRRPASSRRSPRPTSSIVPPSNPVVSVGTILGVPGIADAVRATSASVVGVSPIIGGAPVRGMADKLLPGDRRRRHGARRSARHYGARSARRAARRVAGRQGRRRRRRRARGDRPAPRARSRST